MYQAKDRQIDKAYRIQRSETDPDIHQKVLCNTSVLTYQSETTNYPTNGTGTVGFPYVGNIRYLPLLYTEINFKFSKYLKVKIKTLRRKNVKKKSYELEEGENFLNDTQ